MTWRHIAIGGGLLIALLGLATRLRGGEAAAARSPERRAATVAVTSGTLIRTLTVSGELAAVRAERIVVPRVRERGAVPIQAMAPEGAEVAAGDVVLQIDNAALSASLSIERINLDKAENDLTRKEAEQQALVKELEVEYGNKALDRQKAALHAEIPADLMPLREWQDRQFAHQTATKAYEKVSTGLELARKAGAEDVALLRVKREQVTARIRTIEADLASLQVRASSPGTVIYEHAPLTWNSGDNPRKFQVGDQVSPGMVIMTVPDLSQMEARVYISEVDGGLVRPGLRARLTLDGGGPAFAGQLVQVRHVAERQRRLSNVRVFVGTVALDHSDARLMKPGASVRVELELDAQQGLLLPREVILHRGGQTFVRHASRGQVPVTVLSRNAVSCLVDGLAEHDLVELVP